MNNNSLTKKGGSANRLFSFKTGPAIIAGKLLINLTRLLGRGGTTLPGRVAMKIDPGLTGRLSSRVTGGSIVITGTNGKTTTAALLTSILKQAGLKVIHNQSGSNMSWGVATALMEAATFTGRIEAEHAVLEVDEGAFPQVVETVRPQYIIATNIFRDQLDRYGELDRIQEALGKGFMAQPEAGTAIINADDPSLVALGDRIGQKRLTYGLELDLAEDSRQDSGRDLKICPICRHQLAYERINYAHLGNYFCPSCGFQRQKPQISLTGYEKLAKGGFSLNISYPGGELSFTCPLPGRYNLYNILAAVSCALALKLEPQVIKAALERAVPAFGRMEQFVTGGKNITIALIKNPVGANEVLQTVIDRQKPMALMVAINDKIADGTDVSWLWDVDFEYLAAAGPKPLTLIASGLRACDMAVRFKYAGFEADRISVIENTEKALTAALEKTAPGGELFILPSYTAMLEIRKHLNEMGLAQPYWEGK